MSNLLIRQALEVKLATMTPAVDTAFENVEYNPQAGTPYQEVYLLFAKPDNPTFGDDHYRQRGIMQVTLRYPQNTGALAAAERGELLRDTFHRGLSVIAGGVTTKIDETPDVGDGKNIGDRYVIVVKVSFYADIFKGA